MCGLASYLRTSSREDVRDSLISLLGGRFYIFLLSGCLTYAKAKRSWTDYLFTCWRQGLTSCEARICTWCLWDHILPWYLGVTLSSTSTLIYLWMNTVYIGVTTGELILEQKFFIITLSIHTIWYFLAGIVYHSKLCETRLPNIAQEQHRDISDNY